MNRSEHDEEIRRHFDGIAPVYDRYRDQNRYYNDYLTRWCRAMLPPGGRVLDVGCGWGNVLAAVDPDEGLGIDISPAMIEQAKRVHEGTRLRFERSAIEDFAPKETFDAAICVNTLEYTYDVGVVLDKIHASLRDNGRLLTTTANPLWSPIFHAASKLGLRIPESQRLFITLADLTNMLALHGFEVVYEEMALPLPKWIPLLSGLVNWTLPRIPVARMASSMHVVVARKVPPARRDYSVSIVIPCHNEIGNVDRCIKETKKLGSKTELIFVDDGSTDGTAAAIKPELNKDVEVKVLSYTPNRGKGAAVKAGFDMAQGDILLIVDADLTTHPEELPAVIEAMATGRAEFVNGTRFVYPMEGRAMKWLNYIGNRMFTLLVSLIMERRISDTLCGTKAMFRSNYKHMTMGRDPWGDYDFLFGAAQQRLVLRELPVHYRERTAGVSKMKSLRHTINLLRMCFRGFFQVKTLRPFPRVAPPPPKPGS
jgi:2-polyprenyl-3-methyl-5-hydroxy-6-metoxy-1,4-benzoquinol methylase/Ni2+-binding GTPase involved in maturation of urease and hydrogenase